MAQSLVIPSRKEDLEYLYRVSRDAYGAMTAIVSGDDKAPTIKTIKDSPIVLLYISTMIQLCFSQELFYLGHQLVPKYPNDVLTWYCIGGYYFTVNNFDSAQKYLRKALKKDANHVPSLLLLGHSLSALEESEQAISAYRSAVRVAPSSFLPQLCLGREFTRTNSISLAAHTLNGARSLNGVDVAVLNELGVTCLRLGRLTDALPLFQWALQLLQADLANPEPLSAISTGTGASLLNEAGGLDQRLVGGARFEQHRLDQESICTVMCNYASTLRRMGELSLAASWFMRSLTASPGRAAVMASLAFTLHLQRKFSEAIRWYHAALAVNPRLAMASELLTLALDDVTQFEEAIDDGDSSNGEGGSSSNSGQQAVEMAVG